MVMTDCQLWRRKGKSAEFRHSRAFQRRGAVMNVALLENLRGVLTGGRDGLSQREGRVEQAAG